MSRKEYMERLDMLLRDIPYMERQEALKYYEDYFEDAGEEHEADVIEELGSPEELAEKLREDLNREESRAVPEARENKTAEKENGKTLAGNTRAGNTQTGNYAAKQGQPGVPYAGKKQGSGQKIMTICFIVLGILIGIWHLGRLAVGAVRIVVSVSDLAEGKSVEMSQVTYPAYGEDGIRSLEIDAGIASLVIESWDGEEISVAYPAAYMRVEREGGELSVDVNKRWLGYLRNWIFINSDETPPYEIIVKIPKNYVFREADVSIGAGMASIERLEAESISLKTGAGELEAQDIIATEGVDIETGVGEMVIKNLQATEADLSIGVGELTITGRIDGDISAECGVGELFMKLENAESDFNYDVSCSVGDVTINEREYSGLGRSHSVDNEASYDFDISCGVGSIKVIFSGAQ